MLRIAKILKSNGTEGDILVGMRNLDLEDIDVQEPVFIEFDGIPVPFFILKLTPKGSGKAIIHLNDVDNLQDAEEMVGRDILADMEFEDEDNPDFSGWSILDNGTLLGVCTGLEPIPGNPCLQIGELLIPLHEDLIISADPDKKELNLNLPAGLY